MSERSSSCRYGGTPPPRSSTHWAASGASHHHGFLQVPQQLLSLRVSPPALGLPPVLPSLQPDPASPRPSRSSEAFWPASTLPSTHSLEILAVPGLVPVTAE